MNLNTLDSNIDPIQLNFHDFFDEKINQEKFISEKIKKVLKLKI